MNRPRQHNFMARLAAFAGFASASILLASASACHHAPPPTPVPLSKLSDSAAAALQWVDAHAQRFSVADSMPSSAETQVLQTLAGDARVIGVSELAEGTREFPLVVRHLLFALGDASPGARGLAIQGPMAEAMDLDRYVRTGIGDPRRLVRTLGSERLASSEMLGLIAAIRAWNQAHGADRRIGFYGFEIPSGAHAVATLLALPDSVTGVSLKAWMRQQLTCVANDEAAHFGLEGRASDSTFWNQCGAVVRHVADSVAALRARTSASSPNAERVAFAEQMARLLRHYVTTGLRHLPRQETNAAHVMYLVDELGPDARLVAWGGDVEMGRLTLDRTTVQTGVALAAQLGARYRPIAYAVGGGSLRTRRPGSGATGQPGGYGAITIRRPEPDTYEDVLARASHDAYWLDMRGLPSDSGGAWLRGPREMRLITELYTPQAPQLFVTPIELPKNYDAVVFVRTVAATR